MSTQLWSFIKILDDAEQYLADDAGHRDVTWNDDLQESVLIIRKLANKLRSKAVKNQYQGRDLL